MEKNKADQKQRESQKRKAKWKDKITCGVCGIDITCKMRNEKNRTRKTS